MKILLALIIAACSALAANTPNGYVPNGDTTVVSANVLIYGVGFQLVPGGPSTATVTIKDKSTSCGGSPCTLLVIPLTTAIANAAGTLNGRFAMGGFTWSADCASCTTGWVSYGPPTY